MSEIDRATSSSRVLRSAGFGIFLATFSTVQAAIPPHDGWVLDRSFGSFEPASGASIDCYTGQIPPAIGPTGEVFVVAAGNRIIRRFAPDGALIGSITTTFVVRDMLVRNGKLYIGHQDSLDKYDLVTQQLTEHLGFSIQSMTQDSAGNLFVADFDGDVRRYDANDVYLGNWGVVPQLGRLASLQSVAALNDGRIAGRYAGEVQLFTPLGQYLSGFQVLNASNVTSVDGLIFAGWRFYDEFGNELGKLPSPFGEARPTTFGPDGSLYVCGNYVYKFKPAYRTVSTLVGAGAVPFVEVVGVGLREGATIVDIDYRVNDRDSASVTTAALALLGGNYTIADARRLVTFVDGTAPNLGTGLAANTQHRLSWDAAADVTGAGAAVQAQILVLANDGRTLLDRHYITLPANIPVSGDPELLISAIPVSDADLLNIWMWLLATGDADVLKSGPDLVKVGGPDAGTVLASGTTTTAAGREYLFDRLGVREATTTEVDRARAGTTPGVQQYAPSRHVGTRPVSVNEIGFDSGAASGYWLVPD